MSDEAPNAPPRPQSGAAATTNQPQTGAPAGAPAGGPAGRPAMDPRIQQQQELVRKRLAGVGRITIVMSGKGGVGKSSVAASLAKTLAERGQKVGLLDMDLTGPDLPKFLDVEDAEVGGGKEGMIPIQVTGNLKLMSLAYLLPDKNAAVVWRGPMKMGAIRQLITEVDWGTLDHLIIDLPPGTSDEPLSIAQSVPDADGVVIVTTPHTVSLLDVRKSISFANQIGLHVLGIVENMSGMNCPHCNNVIELFGMGLGEKLAEELELAYLGSVPVDPEASGPTGELSVPAMLREGSPAREAFGSVVDSILAELAERPERKRPDPGMGPLRMSR